MKIRIKIPSISKKNINILLLQVLVFICIIFPSDIFNLKKIVLICIFFLNYGLIIDEIKINSMISLFGFYFPILLIIISTLISGNFIASFQRSFCCFMILIVAVIKKNNIGYKRILLRTITIVSLLTIFIYITDFLGIYNVNGMFPLKEFLYNNDVAIMGKSPEYPFYYKIFIKTSPLVVLCLFESFQASNIIVFLLSLFTVVLSGTRANIFVSISFLVLYFLLFYKNNKKNLVIVKYCIFAVIILITLVNTVNIYNQIYALLFEKSAISDLTRNGHLESLQLLFSNNPSFLIIGMGMGSSFYSSGVNALVNSMEWSYLDLIRQMGIIMFSFYCFFLLFPIKRILNNKPMLCAYIAYLVIAATNPLLFNSTAYLMYIYVYSSFTKSNTIEEEKNTNPHSYISIVKNN